MWADRLLKGLERAKTAHVKADDVVPVLQKHARRAQSAAGLAGRTTKVSIKTEGTKVIVRATGPGAEQVMAYMRGQPVEDVMEVASRKGFDAISGIKRSVQ